MGHPSHRAGSGLVFALGILICTLNPPDAFGGARERHPGPPPPSIPPTSVEYVDGTPRPRPPAALRTEAGLRAGTSRGRGRAPQGDEPQLNLSTITDEAGMEPDIGGDDVLLVSYPNRGGLPKGPNLQAKADGTLFVAVEGTSDTSPNYFLDIFRSTDGGETWTLWSTFVPSDFVRFGDFLVVEGDFDRAFIAYQSNITFDNPVRIAYTDVNSGSPTWTVYSALTVPSADARKQISLDSDAFQFPDYFVYMIARIEEAGGEDVWFARSTNQGTSFGSGFKVADAPDNSLGYFRVQVSAGSGGYIHTAYTRTGTLDDAVFYRRVSACGGGVWDPPVTIDALDNGVESTMFSFKASPEDGDVVLYHDLDFVTKCRYSTDSGANWPPGNVFDSDITMPFFDAVQFPPGRMVVGGKDSAGSERYIEVARSSTGDPTALATPEKMTIRQSGLGNLAHSGAIVCDATRSDRVAAVWEFAGAANRTIRFDAEWRRDPGYPNTDVGFPISIAGQGQTPPAIAQLDDDPEGEIVFGTRLGNVYVVEHDGTIKPGWPVTITGSIPYDAPVAVGDLIGNGDMAIVVGNDVGLVFAYDADGSLLQGWPVDLGEIVNVYVSIGALGPPHARYVLAVGGQSMHALRYDGMDVSPLWGTFAETFTRPAAIGDVDNDGTTEIVTLKGSHFHVHTLASFSSEAFRSFPGEIFSDAPTLADMDNNGTLEIAAPTNIGNMYLLNADGTDYSVDWPVTASSGALTSAALAQFVGTTTIDMAFAGRTDGNVHLYYLTGTPQTGYPKYVGITTIFMPPMLEAVSATSSNISIGTIPGEGRSWRNTGPYSPGWPKNLPGRVEETFASGDIDNDGRNEIVVLGVDFLTVLDVGQPPVSNPRNHWPMYGYDAQRTGCLDCEEIITDVGDTPDVPLTNDIAVYPNPFNPTTTITYVVAQAGPVSLVIYDVGGRRVAILIDGEHREPNRYEIRYDAAGASGVYFIRLVTAGAEITRKMVVLK